ncbi:putative NADP-dependent mannitol dehydrogenase [Colletotrichum sp. SAR11_239]|nr:putative NADP-dependent mannitol dehydrogenase [Colletotrichum sp. SAR11_239]
MASARSALRLTSRLAPRFAIRSQVARPFSISARALKSDVVREKEIPVSVYAPDAKGTGQSDHFSIPVREHDSRPPTETPLPVPENDNVVPLTRKTFDSMPPMMQKLSVMGKTIIVTGGARGLGNYMARACAEAGAKALVIFDANQELGDEAAAELHQKTGLPVTFFKVDVRDGAAINAAVDSVVELYGAPDVLVNSAGIADSNIKAETYDPAMFRRLIDINLTGSFLMSQSVGRAMMKAGKPGSIILVASMSGSIVNYPQEQSCYNASKAGVIQFGKSLAAEWAKYNIRVNCISPGYMDTALNRVPALDAQKKIWKSLTPQDRLGAVDDLNGLCVFLASDASSFMTGSNVIIDGGYTCY